MATALTGQIRRRRVRGRRAVGGFALTALAWAAGVAMIFPVFWMVITSLKQEAAAVTSTPEVLFRPTLDQYRAVLSNGFEPYFINSATASVVSILLVLVLAVPASYALSIRPVKRWKDTLFFFLSTRMLPVVGAIVPLYVLAKNLHMLDNIYTLVILYSAMNLPLAVWMIRSFLAEVPQEILEAGRVDGAGVFREIGSIVLPLIRPGLAATALLCFIFSWNEFFLAVNLTQTRAATAPLYLVGFVSTEGLFWAKLSAASVMATLPVLLAGWAAQKRLVRGLTFGAVK